MTMNNDLRNVPEIREQLADLDETLELAKQYGAPDFASSISLRSMGMEREILLDELRATELRESEYDAELVLKGDPVANHDIHSRFFGLVLVELQDLVNAVAQHIASLRSSSGRVAANIIEQNRLLFSHSFESSFGARFKVAGTTGEHDESRLLDAPNSSALDQVWELLSGRAHSDTLTEYLSHPRIRTHYKALVELLAKQGADFEIRTRGHDSSSRLSAQEARDRSEWLDLLTTQTQTIKLAGTLTGGSIARDRFELQVGEMVIQGVASHDAASQMRSFRLGQTVEAELEVTTSTHDQDPSAEKIVYVLKELVDPELTMFADEELSGGKASGL
jgi:hypothetical protein